MTFKSQINHIFGQALILIFLLLLSLTAGLPILTEGWVEVAPFILLPTVIYWSLFYPSSVPLIPIILAGLLSDIIKAQILGLDSAILLLAFIISRFILIRGKRLHFAGSWAIVLMACCIDSLLRFIFVSGIYQTLPDITPYLFQGLLNAMFYPALAVILRIVIGYTATD